MAWSRPASWVSPLGGLGSSGGREHSRGRRGTPPASRSRYTGDPFIVEIGGIASNAVATSGVSHTRLASQSGGSGSGRIYREIRPPHCGASPGLTRQPANARFRIASREPVRFPVGSTHRLSIHAGAHGRTGPRLSCVDEVAGTEKGSHYRSG